MAQPFQIGDLVTRDGTDVHRVTGTNGYDLIDVVCIKAPAEGWCKVGETETNLARRYSYADDVLDGEAVEIGGALPPPL